ncbi:MULTISPECIES: GMC family oxidoreductase [Salipiger]|uniref:Glucose-methanol-choline oxidoreductase n=1 Tax=Salipiger bermudensis (strain DSM 26914 / JCM 13377 / KCTC 12554 / HTCC2601) TaxID=314265 RepID=Q0FK44_SALBH|nr:choline dehydrogenase [Salipiger bermudensis]MAE90610.1 choline dehydrogenase [Pelagibaca sp.]MBR9892626.1 choline dehydrogenase [bacterium]EAU44561.1 glucose-methanol-choline oxidoreductase [Salipiger bermudensis HTCC2601]MBN9675080.1 choline dehydrogenase [Salipiger bermudensis]MCA1284075.1 choline dehydrogenase [Salipiger bermudensis]
MADYIIIGAGSGGGVLINRLSQDENAEIAVIEAGGWDRSPWIHMPMGYFRLMQTLALDWGYHTVPQKNVNNRVMFVPRARSVGGCSTVNGMIYTRGHRSDYDRWAQMGNRGWDYDSILPYMMRAENWGGGGKEEVHGFDGPLATTRNPIQAEPCVAWRDACMQAGYPFNEDLNSGEQYGVGPCDGTVRDGIRSSVSRCYITPIKKRKNLTFYTNAMASRIIMKGGRAVGVEFVQGRSKKTVYADKEVILCGGAFNSPHLLQISGIGDPEHLNRIGVKVEHELPGVGRNLQDHLASSVKQGLSKPVSLLGQTKPYAAAMALLQYYTTGKGPVAGHGVEVMSFLNSREGLEAPDIQVHFNNIMYKDHGREIINVEGCMPYYNISRPQSRGTVMAKSSDPLQLPELDPNFLSEPEDLRVLREGLRMMRDILAQPAFDSIRGDEYAPGKGVVSDAELDEYIKNDCNSVYHPVGTCKMGSDEMAVVDDELRVRGIGGLRVVDASIMPTLTSGNTNAPTIMIAEKASDMIRAAA